MRTLFFLLFLLFTINSTLASNNGVAAYRNGDYKTAIRIWKPLALKGDAASQYSLGTAYYHGNGVEKNYKQAVKWFIKAAAQNEHRAQINLGWMYQNGYGVTKNYSKAITLYRKAATKGVAGAQNNLAQMYDKGFGVPIDRKIALKWYKKAAAQGDSRAQTSLGMMYFMGYGGLLQNDKEAVIWYRKGAVQNLPAAQYSLGWLYQEGRGVTKDFYQAANWYRKSAEQGHIDAIRNLQILLSDLGFEVGSADGVYNTKTRTLVAQYLNASETKDFFISNNKSKKTLKINDESGRLVASFQNSYALIIGASDYTHGWSKLPSVVDETEDVKRALKKKGFKVTHILNPDHKALEESFKNFIDKHGFDKENRLLFFFSGHGHSRNKHSKGYLVPTNAPDPRIDEKGFLGKALSMIQILAWSREIEAKHVLFLFDSCFSGTLFKSKSQGDIPKHITDLTARPIRYFITAGDAGETVPAKSVFVPALLKGLRGEADLTNDGYITGTELGIYLHDKVIYYGKRQTPQKGRIRDPKLDEGEFVFSVK